MHCYGLLVQFLPVAESEIRWCYRKVTGGCYKICAIHHEEFEKVLKRIEKEKIRCDCFIPAQAIDNLTQCVASHAVTAQIPAELRPIRFKKSKALYGILLMAVLGIAGYAVIRQFQDYRLQSAVFVRHGKLLRRS